jgi:hypothetical protein
LLRSAALDSRLRGNDEATRRYVADGSKIRLMDAELDLGAAIEQYLRSRPRRLRWLTWLEGRRYRLARFAGRSRPLVAIAHARRDESRAREMALALEHDWAQVSARCREAYDEILSRSPDLVVLQLRRRNVCRCLGHRHPAVREQPFAEAHEAFHGASVGEMDIAYDQVNSWPPLPLADTALDAKFFEGSRRTEFRQEQFRLKLLSVFLHETNHLVDPLEPEESVRARSLGFYRDALADYVAAAVSSLSLTIDRSFSRLD